MKIRNLLIPLLLILILVIFNKVFMTTFTRANNYFSTQSLYNEEIVSPQKLFDKTWKLLYRHYYEPTLNDQDW